MLLLHNIAQNLKLEFWEGGGVISNTVQLRAAFFSFNQYHVGTLFEREQ